MFCRLLKLTVVALLLSQAGAAAAAPETFPQITEEQLAQWKQLLVVAELNPGGYDPKKACPENHVCIPLTAAFWLNAKVSATLQGAEPPAQIRVSGASHHGMRGFSAEPGRFLVSLRSDGEQYMMPRNAVAPLVRDRLGALYLPIVSRTPVHWLPCSVESLREEVFQENFEGGEALVKNALYDMRYLASQAPELFHEDAKGAWPRYAIPIARLRDFLLREGPGIQMSCEPGYVARKNQAAPAK